MVREDILMNAKKLLKENMLRAAQGLSTAEPTLIDDYETTTRLLRGESPGSESFFSWECMMQLECVSRENWFWVQYVLELWMKTHKIEETWDRNWRKGEIWTKDNVTIEWLGLDRTNG